MEILDVKKDYSVRRNNYSLGVHEYSDGNAVATKINKNDPVFFDLIESPLYYKDENGNMSVSNRSGIIDGRNGELLYSGSSYIPLRNIDIVESINRYAPDYKLKDTRNYGNKKFVFNYINDNVSFTVNGLEASQRIKISNSYNGTQSLMVEMGFYIKICSNGAVIGHDIIKSKYRHIESNMLDFNDIINNGFNIDKNIVNYLSSKDFNADDNEVKKKFELLTEGLSDKTDTDGNIIYNKIKLLLHDKFVAEQRLYKNNEFALFMASTWLATNGHKYYFSADYMYNIEKKITSVFFDDYEVVDG